MATHGDIGVSQPAASTITMKVRTVTVDMNSTVVHQEILTLGGAESSLEVARVMASAPASTDYGLVVREVNSTGPIAVSSIAGPVTVRSSAANMLVSVYQSTAADLNVTVAGYSTTANVSSVAGRVAIAGFHAGAGIVNVTDSTNNAINVNVVAGAAAGSTNVTVGRMVGNSSAQDYMPVRIVDSSGTGFLPPGLEYTDGSTTSTLAAPSLSYNNSSNNTMRVVGLSQPLPVQLRTGALTFTSAGSSVTSSASSAFYPVVSSAAGAQHVFAYSVTSTAVTPFRLEFLSGTGTVVWSVLLGSASSGVTGANLAVSPPGRLFSAAAASPLQVRLGSTGVEVVLGLSWFTE